MKWEGNLLFTIIVRCVDDGAKVEQEAAWRASFFSQCDTLVTYNVSERTALLIAGLLIILYNYFSMKSHDLRWKSLPSTFIRLYIQLWHDVAFLIFGAQTYGKPAREANLSENSKIVS